MKCPSCKFYSICKGRLNETVENCVRFKSVEPTNEDWFCGLSTEEKAKWLEEKMTWAAQEQGTFTAKGWEKWLKQPHKEKHNG